MPSGASFFGSLIFGAIGMAAFVYGKSTMQAKKMLLGGVLMISPYFISDTWLLWGIGIALTAGLVNWKECG
jgi:hypothetical protein